jgi:hypothetical protein
LAIKQLTYNPCFLYNNRPFNVINLQIDDTLFVKDDDFIKKEQASLEKAKFLAKERERLTFNNDLKFNKGVIHASDTSITLTQVR